MAIIKPKYKFFIKYFLTFLLNFHLFPNQLLAQTAVDNLKINLETKLTALDPQTLDSFGSQLVIDKNIIVVGARAKYDLGEKSGAVYVFEKINNNWVQTAKLLASDGKEGDIFGDVLALDNGIIVAGSLGAEKRRGAVYIFEKINGNWQQTTKLLASDGKKGDVFGFPTIYENIIIVGSFNALSKTGAVYVFEKINDNWQQTTKLLASDGKVGDRFGRYVSLYKDTLAIGAVFGDGNQVESGAVYIFEKNNDNWQETAKLVASDGESQDKFGRVVKIRENVIVVGSPFNNNSQGAVYVFEKSEGVWKESIKLIESNPREENLYGASVALNDDLIIVASRNDNDNGENSGSAYIYQKSDGNWKKVLKILPEDGQAGDVFGKRLDISDQTLIIGAFLDDENNTPDSGSVYVYYLNK